MFRRALSADPDRRSPLPEQQVQHILNSRGRVHVVAGSLALGIDRVADALREAAPEDIDVHAASCGTFYQVVTGLAEAGTRRSHLILDLGSTGEDEQRATLVRLHEWVAGDPRPDR